MWTRTTLLLVCILLGKYQILFWYPVLFLFVLVLRFLSNGVEFVCGAHSIEELHVKNKQKKT